VSVEQLGMASINGVSLIFLEPDDVGSRRLWRRRQLGRE
jgi:hypothetical protein